VSLITGTLVDLPMWPSGQRTQPPCAVERDTLSGRGLRLTRARLPTKELFLISSMHMMNRELNSVNSGQVRGFDGVFYKL